MKIKAHIIFILLIGTNLIGQSREYQDFEKRYLEFHEKWDAGYDASIEEVEELFKDCPDLKRFPHYFIYKGDLLCDKGYYDLGIKYYLIAEKLIDQGYENKKIYDHRPVMYFKLGYAYADLYMPEQLLEYIKKGKSYLEAHYAFQTEYDFTELEAIYLFNHTDRKSEAIEMLEALYEKAEKHKESPIYHIINTTRLRTVDYAMKVQDFNRAEKLLDKLKSDPWIKTINGVYLRWYYSVNSDFSFYKEEYDKAIAYNDSIYRTSPLELEDKESLFESYIEIHSQLGNYEIANNYRDSLGSVLKVQRRTRQKSSVLLTEENHKYEKMLATISRKNSNQELLWILSSLLLLGLILVIYRWFVSKKSALLMILNRETKRMDVLNDNYKQLLKNYQLTTSQLAKIKNVLAEEIQKNKSPEIISIQKAMVSKIQNSQDVNLLSIDELRDQFMINIKEEMPELSNYERLICFYTKMEMSAKEIGQVTNHTVRSIQSHQYRIGKKTLAKYDLSLKDFLETVPLSEVTVNSN